MQRRQFVALLQLLPAALLRRTVAGSGLAALSSVVGARPGMAAGVEVGAVEQIAGSCRATGADGVARTLSIGTRIFEQDRLTTAADSTLGIRFADDTVFDLGPNADVVIDEHVYAPGSESFVASVLKGGFRFVSGNIARTRPDAMEVHLPIAVIGVRGTHVAGEVLGEDGAETAAITLLESEDLFPSAIVVTNEAGTTVMDQPGTGTDISGRGRRPSEARAWAQTRRQAFFERNRLGARYQQFGEDRQRRISERLRNLTPDQRADLERRIAERRTQIRASLQDPAEQQRLRERFEEQRALRLQRRSEGDAERFQRLQEERQQRPERTLQRREDLRQQREQQREERQERRNQQ